MPTSQGNQKKKKKKRKKKEEAMSRKAKEGKKRRRRVQEQGWLQGRVGLKDGVFIPAHIVLSYPISVPFRPASYDGKNFLTPFPPLGALRSPAFPHPVKFYFLLICPTTSTIFIMKPINKNILEIITKFIPSKQINFQEKKNE